MIKEVRQLVPGDVIPPPKHEQGWLWRDGKRRMLTVLSVTKGRVDKRGLWLVVTANYGCPYDDGVSKGAFEMRPMTKVATS